MKKKKGREGRALRLLVSFIHVQLRSKRVLFFYIYVYMFRELISRGLFYKKNSAKTKMSKGMLSGYFTFSVIEKGKNGVLGRGKSCLVGVVFFQNFVSFRLKVMKVK